MSDYERSRTSFSELGPPDEVAIDADHWLHLANLGSHEIDIRGLRRPINILDDESKSLTDEQRTERDAYITQCEADLEAIWHETEMFITETSLEANTAPDEDALFYARLAFTELVQNAFRHGGRPQRVSASVVTASDAFSFIPRQPSNTVVQLQPPRPAAATGNRILLGVQDASSVWRDPEVITGDELPEHLRGLDIVRGVSKALWYRSDAPTSKWVWTLI